MGIKTRIEDVVVHTVIHNKLWVTIVSSDKLQSPIKIQSLDANNLQDAGMNHIRLCQQVKIALITNKGRADIPSVSATETEHSTELTETHNG